MADLIEVKIPDIGTSDEVDVIEVLVSPGDTIEVDSPLITLEGDKASMDVPSPAAGIVKTVAVTVGDKVTEGALILTLTKEGAAKEEVTPAPKAKESEKPPAAKSSEPQVEEITVSIPDIGASADVDVIEISVAVGDTVDKEQSLITVEGEKAAMEVPSPYKGEVLKLLLKIGDKVNTGDPILQLKASIETDALKSDVTTQAPEVQQAKSAQPERTESKSVTTGQVYAGPAVRRVAREFGVNLSLIKGTGRKGRISMDDVRIFVKSQLQKGPGTGVSLDIAPAPKVDFEKFGEIKTVPLSKIKRFTGKNVHRSWVMIPHVTHFDESDITDMEAYRKANKEKAVKEGYKLTPLVFIMKALVKTLEEFPSFNASLSQDGASLVLKKYTNMGIAVDTPEGLVVPVIKDVPNKDIKALAIELGQMSQKARDGALSIKDMQGGTFTISSLGGIGGVGFTPIINGTDVAILGISKAKMVPSYNGKDFEPRLIMPFSLSYDHRVIDGAQAARFCKAFASKLSDIKSITQ